MALMKQAPSVPSTRGINDKANAEFIALKHNLDSMASWEMSPNNWDKIQIAYPIAGNEAQTRSFLASVQLPTPEM
jgi:hypothetical protein